MATSRRDVWVGSAQRMRAGWLLLQLIGNAVLAIGAWAWLHIPDSHVWQFALSIILGILLVGLAVWLYATSISAARQANAHARLWYSGVWFLAGVIVSILWMHLVARLATNVELRAGYWNSQLSAHMRTILTYPRLIEIQNAVIVSLSWLLPLLLLPVVVELVTRGWAASTWRYATRVWLRWQFWLVSIVALFAGCKLTSALVDWHPTYTVRGEVISVVLRLALAYGLNILLGCAVLAVTCELLSQASLGKGVAGDTAA